MAPEACRGKFEPATDVWAVGAMTAQLLTGELPFNDPISPKMPYMQRVLRWTPPNEPSSWLCICTKAMP